MHQGLPLNKVEVFCFLEDCKKFTRKKKLDIIVASSNKLHLIFDN
jgi:hypothetical protein